jgi:hypothetical protein
MIKKGRMRNKTVTARTDVTNFILFLMQNAVLLRIKEKNSILEYSSHYTVVVLSE